MTDWHDAYNKLKAEDLERENNLRLQLSKSAQTEIALNTFIDMYKRQNNKLQLELIEKEDRIHYIEGAISRAENLSLGKDGNATDIVNKMRCYLRGIVHINSLESYSLAARILKIAKAAVKRDKTFMPALKAATQDGPDSDCEAFYNADDDLNEAVAELTADQVELLES